MYLWWPLKADWDIRERRRRTYFLVVAHGGGVRYPRATEKDHCACCGPWRRIEISENDGERLMCLWWPLEINWDIRRLMCMWLPLEEERDIRERRRKTYASVMASWGGVRSWGVRDRNTNVSVVAPGGQVRSQRTTYVSVAAPEGSLKYQRTTEKD